MQARQAAVSNSAQWQIRGSHFTPGSRRAAKPGETSTARARIKFVEASGLHEAQPFKADGVGRQNAAHGPAASEPGLAMTPSQFVQARLSRGGSALVVVGMAAPQRSLHEGGKYFHGRPHKLRAGRHSHDLGWRKLVAHRLDRDVTAIVGRRGQRHDRVDRVAMPARDKSADQLERLQPQRYVWLQAPAPRTRIERN